MAVTMEEETPQSPLKGVGPLLRFYSWVGAFPASISKDYTTFTISWLRYLIAIAFILFFNAALYLVPKLLDYERDGGGESLSMLDELYEGLYVKLQIICCLFMIILNHRQISRYTYLIDKFTDITRGSNHKQPTKLVNALRPLLHHLIILALNPFAFLLSGLAAAHGYNEDVTAFAEEHGPWVVLYLEGFRILSNAYLTIFVTIQELIIDRFLQVLAFHMKRFLAPDYIVDTTTPDLCRDLRACLEAYNALAKSIGSILFVFVSFASTQLLFSAYYFCTFFLDLTQSSAEMGATAKALMCSSHALLCASYVKRMLHLADREHQVADLFSAATETLIEMEGHPEKGTIEVSSLRRLLERVDGLPAKGFFSMNRSMVLVVLGHIATYLIIMLEFKNEDMSANGQSANASWAQQLLSKL